MPAVGDDRGSGGGAATLDRIHDGGELGDAHGRRRWRVGADRKPGPRLPTLMASGMPRIDERLGAPRQVATLPATTCTGVWTAALMRADGFEGTRVEWPCARVDPPRDDAQRRSVARCGAKNPCSPTRGRSRPPAGRPCSSLHPHAELADRPFRCPFTVIKPDATGICARRRRAASRCGGWCSSRLGLNSLIDAFRAP